MKFKSFRDNLVENFKSMTDSIDRIYVTSTEPDKLYETYLNSFPDGTNNIFRTRKEHDCSACRSFIKKFGNVVTIKDGIVKSIWDFKSNDFEYDTVCKAMSKYVKSFPIKDVFLTWENMIGIPSNKEMIEGVGISTWYHFYVHVPNKFIVDKNSVNEKIAENRDVRNVFKRSLDEISIDAVNTVLELISQNSIYRGNEWESVLKIFKGYKNKYDNLDDKQKELFVWEKFFEAGVTVGKIRNHSMGVLLTDISNNMNLDEAVRRYESIVAPTNYKRPKPVYTKKMLDDARKTIESLGYMDSLNRRFAKIDDISINNVLFANRNIASNMKDFDVFSVMEKESSNNRKKFSKVEEIAIEDFIEKVLPNVSEVEVMFENRHRKNMVSLITSEKESKSMFKWNNSFSWAYTGNIADSNIKENVKSAGGNVNGVMRFSIQWNDEDYNPNDFDAHCKISNGSHIYYGNKYDYFSHGQLDVDIIYPSKDVPAVENIVWTDRKYIEDATYRMFVHCYSNNGGKSGFKAEIEINGEIYTYNYNKFLRQDEKVYVADIIVKNGKISLGKEYIDSNSVSLDCWGLKTNNFIPVKAIMYSPNYWDEQNGIGNKHYFFMLDECVNPENPNGFYNEYLKQELLKHKNVFEALGNKLSVVDADDQLSGVGFSSTIRNDIIVKVKGNIERIMKVKF